MKIRKPQKYLFIPGIVLLFILINNCQVDFTNKLSKPDNIYTDLIGMWYFERPSYYDSGNEEWTGYYRNYIQFEGTKNFIYWSERENGYQSQDGKSHSAKWGQCTYISESWYSNDTPQSIPDDGMNIAESKIYVDSGANYFSEITVQLKIIHTATEQLTISLRSPSGYEIFLSKKNTSGVNMEDTVFEDCASFWIGDGAAPYSGSFYPEQLFSNFDSYNFNGEWILTIFDDTGGDAGELQYWNIGFNTDSGGNGDGGPDAIIFGLWGGEYNYDKSKNRIEASYNTIYSYDKEFELYIPPDLMGGDNSDTQCDLSYQTLYFEDLKVNKNDFIFKDGHFHDDNCDLIGDEVKAYRITANLNEEFLYPSMTKLTVTGAAFGDYANAQVLGLLMLLAENNSYQGEFYGYSTGKVENESYKINFYFNDDVFADMGEIRYIAIVGADKDGKWEFSDREDKTYNPSPNCNNDDNGGDGGPKADGYAINITIPSGGMQNMNLDDVPILIQEEDNLTETVEPIQNGDFNDLFAECGNCEIEADEQCDDGDSEDNGNGCDSSCMANNECGNLTVEDAIEECDDGNTTDDGNGCDETCMANNVCGNGTVEDAVEECDDSNMDDGDGCSSSCKNEF
jgi:cysteine-rich repeat protein